MICNASTFVLTVLETKTMLYTDLQHIENANEFALYKKQYNSIVVLCGRMNSQTVNVYRELLELKELFSQIVFCDLDYDNPEFNEICISLKNIENTPLLLFIKNNKIVTSTTGVIEKEKIQKIINNELI